jgi:hypothetical protein
MMDADRLRTEILALRADLYVLGERAARLEQALPPPAARSRSARPHDRSEACA